MAQHGACTLFTVTLSLEIYNADGWLDETHVGSFPSTTAMPASVLFMSRHCKEYGNKFVWVSAGCAPVRTSTQTLRSHIEPDAGVCLCNPSEPKEGWEGKAGGSWMLTGQLAWSTYQ